MKALARKVKLANPGIPVIVGGARGILDEDRDWDKTFKWCDIDPDTVPQRPRE